MAVTGLAAWAGPGDTKALLLFPRSPRPVPGLASTSVLMFQGRLRGVWWGEGDVECVRCRLDGVDIVLLALRGVMVVRPRGEGEGDWEALMARGVLDAE